jgi:hypothetical protein
MLCQPRPGDERGVAMNLIDGRTDYYMIYDTYRMNNPAAQYQGRGTIYTLGQKKVPEHTQTMEKRDETT